MINFRTYILCFSLFQKCKSDKSINNIMLKKGRDGIENLIVFECRKFTKFPNLQKYHSNFISIRFVLSIPNALIMAVCINKNQFDFSTRITNFCQTLRSLQRLCHEQEMCYLQLLDAHSERETMEALVVNKISLRQSLTNQ